VKHYFCLFGIVIWAQAASVNAEPTGPSVVADINHALAAPLPQD
jgi:hypothetical protein